MAVEALPTTVARVTIDLSAAIGDGWAKKLQKMNYQVNWATTANEGESHGTWMPFNLSTLNPFKHGWTTCMGVPVRCYHI